MQSTLDDRFVVYVRDEGRVDSFYGPVERELVSCSTYEEAEWVRQECAGPNRKCIIRYIGPAGGGD
jgi:hypothetical protein